jgi:predicted transcriptional regulator
MFFRTKGKRASSMRSTTKTQERTIIIIPKQTTPQTGDTRRYMKKPRLLTVLLSLAALIALIHFIAVTHQADPVGIPTNCLGLIRTTDYARVIHLQPSSQEMGAVQIVSQLDGGRPAVLVEVMNTGSQHALDIYMFGCTMQRHSPQLTTLFTQRALIQGTAAISPANTLITGELDTSLSPQAVALLQPQQGNIYREYNWQYDRFVQVSFPSLYPAASRSEAETLQQQADSGQSLPWSDPLITAKQMAKDIFKWPANSSQNSVLNNNGTIAQVQLVQQNPPMRVTVTLKRLLQQDKAGIWFVTGAQTSGIRLKQPQISSVVTSPASIKGTGALAGGLTTATLFDHTLAPLSLLNNPTLNVDTNGTYAGVLFYTNSVQNQPGLLLIESLPSNGSSEAGQLLLTRVILG